MKDLESRLKKELSFPYIDVKTYGNVELSLVDSSFNISKERREILQNGLDKYNEENPKNKKRNSKLIRYEGNKEVGNKRIIEVSITDYISLFVPKYLKMEEKPYANPIGVNALQITKDGYIPLAVKNENTENVGQLVSLGSGFIDVEEKNGKYVLENVFSALGRECNEETLYNSENPFNIERAIALGAVFGDSHDTGIVFYIPLNVKSENINKKSKEHSYLIKYPVDKESIKFLLNKGYLEGYRLSDQLMGSIKLFLDNELYKKFN